MCTSMILIRKREENTNLNAVKDVFISNLNSGNMKNSTFLLIFFFIYAFVTSCTDDDKEGSNSYAVFSQEELHVPNAQGEVVVQVEWSAAKWELDLSGGSDIVTSVLPQKGGGNDAGRHYTAVKLIYEANFGSGQKKQNVVLKNLTTGETSTLVVVQDGNEAVSSDNGDGTFTNPVLWMDVPDPDVIRVGEYFYMVNTTMHMMPGAAIMRSRDLVNWEIISYVYDNLDIKEDYYLLNGKTVYGRGQWATSLRYNNGRFYVFFSPNDSPREGYVYSTENPETGWRLEAVTPQLHDASMLFDDDGKVYMFYGSGRLARLSPDMSEIEWGPVDIPGVKDAEETGLLEGSRVIKHNGKYYLLMISSPNGGHRRQVCYRADNVTGPYEKKVILEDNFDGYSYVGQGCIVDGPDGNWYGVLMQDRGGVGRVVTLMPCRWVDGWPMLGDENGRIPEVMDKPVQGCAPSQIVVSDDFSHEDLLLNWQWNHNPVDDAWSLSEREGYLRLKTARVVDNVFLAPNTLTQRMEGPECTATVSLEVSHMNEGDVAGFAAFNGTAGLLSVKKKGGKKFLSMTSETVQFQPGTKVVSGVDVSAQSGEVELLQDKVYLRIDADFRRESTKDIAKFYYSFDNMTWMRIGTDFKMSFNHTLLFVGTRFAIYNYATKSTGGYVDIDFFNYKRIRK